MKPIFYSGLLVFFFSISVFSQDMKGTDAVPFDPNIKKGVLKNGLTYYVRKNAIPENKVYLRLIVNAGSVLEEDDQQGLAHFMEHMCFNGTKRFPKNQLVDYLQSIGVIFGQHLNAYTSFDETVYYFPIPSDNPEKLEKGFQILEDWAFNANLTPEEIDKERGVVLEEYRLRLGAYERMQQRYIPKMMYESRYAERMPIGKKEILENFKYDKLVSFYKDWYRPDLMAVIVVGDINVAEMEQKIKDHFEGYQNPKNEKPRKTFEVPNHKETFVCIESDKEASQTQVQLMYKDYGTREKIKTYNDYRKKNIEYLFTSMLNSRLNDLTKKPNSPFTYPYISHWGAFARDKEAFQSSAMVQENNTISALKVLVTEFERVKKFGFTQTELDRVKTSFLVGDENYYKDRNKQNSEGFVEDCQDNFLYKNPSPTTEWVYENNKKLLPTITLKEVNSLMADYIKEDNRVVIITGPEKEGIKRVTEAEVMAALKVDSKELKPYEDKAVVKSLLRNPVKEGSILKTETNSKLGTKTLFLSNGAKVNYKKTDFKDNDIILEAISLGGTSLYSDEDMKKTEFANGGLTEAGFSGLDKIDIGRFMSGKTAYVSPYIRETTEDFYGWTTPKDLEYLMQMLYAYFTDLNFDPLAFERYKKEQSARYDNMIAQPDFYFQQEFYTYLNKENPRWNGIAPTQEKWKETDYKLAYEKYKERFANAGDFEFFFVGNIDDKQMETLAAKYIASLPSVGGKEVFKDLGYRILKGDLKMVVNKGVDPKSKVTIMYYGETNYTPKEAISMEALGEILTIKLTEQLREKESGVYRISALGYIKKVPYGYYNFSFSFPCGPDNTEKLIQLALNELNKIITNGPEEKDLNKYKQAEILEYKVQMKQNYFWLDSFADSFVNSNNPEEILEWETKVNNLTAKDIQDVAKKYLTKDKVIGILMPEVKK